MAICLHIDGHLLGCNWIKLKINPFMFDLWGDTYTVYMHPKWIGIAHNVQSITITRRHNDNGVYDYCCSCK